MDNGGGIVLVVTDTGVGMSESDIVKALEPFEQAHITSSDLQKGTGLGLYLSANFMNLFDGSLGIESEPGEGTTVTIRFPPERTIQPS